MKRLAFVHRWLGIVCGALFLLWFLSGLAMLWVAMPALEPGERLRRLAPLDLEAAAVHPAAAAERAGLVPDRLRIGMQGGRPIYRFAQAGVWSAVFADDGRVLLGLRDEEALRVAADYAPECASILRHDGLLTAPDQWTLQSRALLPLHRLACGGSRNLYVSDRTGEVVLETDRSSRFLAYLGPVAHWLYFTPLRRHGSLWQRLLLLLSFLGCVLSLSGLAVGIARFSAGRRRRERGLSARSPYRGAMLWHHYAGLVFGAVAFTWIMSGGLSLDPFGWGSSTAPTKAQREAVAGGPLDLRELHPDRLRAGLATLRAFSPRELEVVQLAGEPYLLADRPPAEPWRGRARPGRDPGDFLSPVQALETRLVSVREPTRARARFAPDTLLEAATRAMPGVPVVATDWIDRSDAYYDDRPDDPPLPALRVRYRDPDGTWLYLDPSRGLVVHRENRSTRLDRWFYRALHRWDFPGLRERPLLRETGLVVLLAGGVLLGTTSFLPAMRRLRAHARRWLGRG